MVDSQYVYVCYFIVKMVREKETVWHGMGWLLLFLKPTRRRAYVPLKNCPGLGLGIGLGFVRPRRDSPSPPPISRVDPRILCTHTDTYVHSHFLAICPTIHQTKPNPTTHTLAQFCIRSALHYFVSLELEYGMSIFGDTPSELKKRSSSETFRPIMETFVCVCVCVSLSIYFSLSVSLTCRHHLPPPMGIVQNLEIKHNLNFVFVLYFV